MSIFKGLTTKKRKMIERRNVGPNHKYLVPRRTGIMKSLLALNKGGGGRQRP